MREEAVKLRGLTHEEYRGEIAAFQTAMYEAGKRMGWEKLPANTTRACQEIRYSYGEEGCYADHSSWRLADWIGPSGVALCDEHFQHRRHHGDLNKGGYDGEKHESRKSEPMCSECGKKL